MTMNKFALGAAAAGIALFFVYNRQWTPPHAATPYLPLIRKQEEVNEIPHNLLARLLEQESDFNPKAHNTRTDAQGMAQIVPRWHPNINNPFDPNEAIPYAAKYLKRLYVNFGTWDLALAAYNWGWGNMRKLLAKHGNNGFEFMPKETQNYVTEILGDL